MKKFLSLILILIGNSACAPDYHYDQACKSNVNYWLNQINACGGCAPECKPALIPNPMLCNSKSTEFPASAQASAEAINIYKPFFEQCFVCVGQARWDACFPQEGE